MKYLAVLDIVETDLAKVAKKQLEYDEAKRKDSDRYPNVLLPAHVIYKGLKGFSVWEGDEDQLARKVAFMLPEVQYTLHPIVDARKFLKTYMEVKK